MEGMLVGLAICFVPEVVYKDGGHHMLYYSDGSGLAWWGEGLERTRLVSIDTDSRLLVNRKICNRKVRRGDPLVLNIPIPLFCFQFIND